MMVALKSQSLAAFAGVDCFSEVIWLEVDTATVRSNSPAAIK
jgi:hypothetical protein